MQITLDIPEQYLDADYFKIDKLRLFQQQIQCIAPLTRSRLLHTHRRSRDTRLRRAGVWGAGCNTREFWAGEFSR